MNRPLLSIVIPTKDRYIYLLILLEELIGYNLTEIEVIVEDNSKSNKEYLAWQKENTSSIIKYTYNPNYAISAVENCNNAVGRATGDYICFIGDDDGISYHLIAFVKWLKLNSYDAASFKKAIYLWPDIKHKYLGSKFSGVLQFNDVEEYSYLEHDAEKELKILLEGGAQNLDFMPKSYHAVISRLSLEKLYSSCSSYFPGPVPDMANAVGLVPFVNKMIYTDAPLVISGNAAKSMAGKGAQKKHLGKIEEQPSLPKNTATDWTKELPKFWSGPTIWAEGALKALKATGQNEKIIFFNWPYFYTFCLIFTSGYKMAIFNSAKNKLVFSDWMKVGYYFIIINFKRIKPFFNNYLGIKENRNISSKKELPTIKECQEFLNKQVELKQKFWEIKN